MTEQEWLTCEDPQRMLRSLRREWEKGGEYYIVSSRKLRLFACACYWLAVHHVPTPEAGGRPLETIRMVEAWADHDKEPPLQGMPFRRCTDPDGDWELISAAELAESANSWARSWRFDESCKADALRDIIGNPFRPIYWADDPKRHAEPYTGPSRRPNPQDVPHLDMRRSWLTPTVVTLAEAANEERVEPCGHCVGRELGTPNAWKMQHPCRVCHGAKRAVGTLDPVRLAVLADALEEAGVPGEVECKACDGKGWHPGDMGCGACGATSAGSVGSGRVPHPLLAHLRSPGPHHRGCWAADLLTGKE